MAERNSSRILGPHAAPIGLRVTKPFPRDHPLPWRRAVALGGFALRS